MQYTYLNWSLLLLLLWALVFIGTSRGKRKMLTVSLGTLPLGLSEPLFYPEYWFPPTLFDMAAHTGFDIESLFFSFAVGGLASSLYEIRRHSRLERVSACYKSQPRHRFHTLVLASPILIFIPMFTLLTINIIYSASIAMLAGGIAIGLCRPDLWLPVVHGSLIFTGFYFLFFATMSWVHPDYVAAYWNIADISGLMVAGVPLEELMFAATFGMMWSGIYEHFGWYRSSEPKSPSNQGSRQRQHSQ